MDCIKHLRSFEPINDPWVAIEVMGISVVLEALSLPGAMIEIRKISHGKSFFRWFRETRQSELMVLAGEDHCHAGRVGIGVCSLGTYGHYRYSALGHLWLNCGWSLADGHGRCCDPESQGHGEW